MNSGKVFARKKNAVDDFLKMCKFKEKNSRLQISSTAKIVLKKRHEAP